MQSEKILQQVTKRLMTEQAKHKSTAEKIHDFERDLEKSDFYLSAIIEYGFILYGQSRGGKTSSGHLLSGNALKAVKIAGDDKVVPATSKFREAEIGTTMNSATTVPNFFQIKLPQDHKQKAYVIDTPGYGDTKGVFQILSNGYHHYRLYSKVQNMKFVICFDAIELSNTADKFIDTIVQFTSYFKDYEDQRHKIWKSSVFLINKVDQNTTFQDLKTKLSQIQKSINIAKSQRQIQLIKEFIRFIVSEERIFTIKKYKAGESATRAQLLEQIDKKAVWWKRQINPQKPNQVDMQKIAFNLTKPILLSLTASDVSKDQFKELIMYYQQRIDEILSVKNKQNMASSQSLYSIINQFIKNTMGAPDSHSFLDVMKRYVEKYYRKLDPKYQQMRDKRQVELMSLQSSNSSDKVNSQIKERKTKDKNYIVKKFEACENIQKMKMDLNAIEINQTLNNTKQLMESIELMSKGVFNIIREFNRVAYKKKNSTEIIYKYGYLIYRVINEVTVLLMLMLGGSSKSQELKIGSNRIQQAADGKFLRLDRPLTGFMGVDYYYKDRDTYFYEQLKDEYIREVDLESDDFKKVVINWSLVELFETAGVDQPVNKPVDQPINKAVGQSDNKPDKKPADKPVDKSQIIRKIVLLIDRFAIQMLDDMENHIKIDYNDRVRLIEKLMIARDNCIQLRLLEEKDQKKDQYLFLIRRITSNMGRLLESVNQYKLARKAYESIFYVDSVCRLYELEIQGMKKIKQDYASSKDINNPQKFRNEKMNVTADKQNKEFNLRMDYGQYLMKSYRMALGIKMFQEAFELARNKDELIQVKAILSEAMLQMKNPSDNNEYQAALFEESYFVQFDEELQNDIHCLAKSVDGQQ